MYILLSAKRRAYFCKSIALEMGGVPRYFSKVSHCIGVRGRFDSPQGLVIVFSLTETPLPDPTPTPPNTPRLARSRLKRTELELDILQVLQGSLGDKMAVS